MLVEVDGCHVVRVVVFMLEDAVSGVICGNIGGVCVGWVATLMVLVVTVGVLVRSRFSIIVAMIVVLINTVHVFVRAGLGAVNSLEDSVLVEVDRCHVVRIIVFVLEDAVCGVIRGDIGRVRLLWVAALVILESAVGVLIGRYVSAIVVLAIKTISLDIIRVGVKVSS